MTPSAEETPARQRIRVAAIAVALAWAASARADFQTEFWPEFEAWVRLTDSTQLLMTGSDRRDADGGDRTNGQGAAYLDYHVSDQMSLRGGFVYSKTLTKDSIEHRLVYDFNYKWTIGDNGQLADRTRIDLRDIAGADSYRIRNRLRFQQDLKSSKTIVPYASIEAFYSTR